MNITRQCYDHISITNHRRVTVGGPGSDIEIPANGERQIYEISRFAGHWMWRPANQQEAWKPLEASTQFQVGELTLVPQLGMHNQFA